MAVAATPISCVSGRRAHSPWWLLLTVAFLFGQGLSEAKPRPRLFSDQFFPVEIRWGQDLASAPLAPPITDGQIVVLLLRDATLACIGVADGKVRWRVPTTSTLAPAVGAGVVVAVADAIESLDPATGSAAWRTPLPSPPATPPLVRAGWVVQPLESGEVVALSEADGTQVWRATLGARARVTPAVDGDLVFVGLDDGRIVALEVKTGTERWSQRIGGAIAGLFAIDGRVFVGGRDNFFHTLSQPDGLLLWKWRAGADVVGAPAVDESNVYFSSLDNVLRALDRRNGSQRWKAGLLVRPTSGPMILSNTIIVGGLATDVRGVSAKDGKPNGRAALDLELIVPPAAVHRQLPQLSGLLVVNAAGTIRLLMPRIEPPFGLPTDLPAGTPVPLTIPAGVRMPPATAPPLSRPPALQ